MKKDYIVSGETVSDNPLTAVTGWREPRVNPSSRSKGTHANTSAFLWSDKWQSSSLTIIIAMAITAVIFGQISTSLDGCEKQPRDRGTKQIHWTQKIKNKKKSVRDISNIEHAMKRLIFTWLNIYSVFTFLSCFNVPDYAKHFILEKSNLSKKKERISFQIMSNVNYEKKDVKKKQFYPAPYGNISKLYIIDITFYLFSWNLNLIHSETRNKIISK